MSLNKNGAVGYDGVLRGLPGACNVSVTIDEMSILARYSGLSNPKLVGEEEHSRADGRECVYLLF
jgi:hypothetical protein